MNAAVPEPSSILAFGAGLLGLAAVKIRRRRRSSQRGLIDSRV